MEYTLFSMYILHELFRPGCIISRQDNLNIILGHAFHKENYTKHHQLNTIQLVNKIMFNVM